MTAQYIDVLVKDGEIWMPVDKPVSAGHVTWRVWRATGDVTTGFRIEPAAANWLVSFRDGAAFDVGTFDDAKQAVNGPVVQSPDVRDGQGIAFAKGAYRPGRYSYRVTVFHGGHTYGVFDCPSIIIT